MHKFTYPFLAVFRVVPTFALLSIIGCVIGHFCFHIPHGELGVAVSVPMVVGFFITRVLLVVIPDPPATETPPHPPMVRFLAAFLIFVSAAVTAVMLPSAFIYALIGLKPLVWGTVFLALCTLAAAVSIWALGVLFAITSSIRLASMTRYLKARARELFWDVLSVPTRLSVLVLGHHYGNPMY